MSQNIIDTTSRRQSRVPYQELAMMTNVDRLRTILLNEIEDSLLLVPLDSLNGRKAKGIPTGQLNIFIDQDIHTGSHRISRSEAYYNRLKSLISSLSLLDESDVIGLSDVITSHVNIIREASMELVNSNELELKRQGRSEILRERILTNRTLLEQYLVTLQTNQMIKKLLGGI